MVDHDLAGPPLTDLAAHPRLHVRRSARPGGWGGYGLVQSVLDAFSAIRAELDPDWTVLLSGQDYPAAPADDVRARLGPADDSDAWLTVFDRVADRPGSEAERWWHARYFYRWFALPRTPALLSAGLREKRRNAQFRFSRAQPWVFFWTLPRGGGTRLGIRRRTTPFGAAYPCWTGSQWMALSRRAVGVLEREIGERPELVRLYRRSLIPDESLIQTILLNAAELRVAQPGLTYQRFVGDGGAHAAELTLGDLAAIEESGRPFVRKVHAQRSAELMERLDARLGLR